MSNATKYITTTTMNTKEIIKEWTQVKEMGSKSREEGIRTGQSVGLLHWQKPKEKYSKDEQTFKTSIKIKDLVKANYRVDSIDTDHQTATVAVGDIVLENKIESHHFIVQMHRLIAMHGEFTLSMLRLMQIAYNIGQADADIQSYNTNVQIYLKTNGLDQIATYIEI